MLGDRRGCSGDRRGCSGIEEGALGREELRIGAGTDQLRKSNWCFSAIKETFSARL